MVVVGPPGTTTEEPVGVVNPDDARQRAVEDGLVIQREDPLNCETPVDALTAGIAMPTSHFYVRNHFPIPKLDPETWRLAIGGLVKNRLLLSLREIRNMGAQSIVATLECAGNGRVLLDPPVDGEPWSLGAVSTAEWTGVPLIDVLERAGPTVEASHVVFRGGDRGTAGGGTDVIRFERSLTLAEAHDSDALLVYAMNGEPLPRRHGFPLRLIVPGWYGVASVKWLTDIVLTDHASDGFFQSERYFYDWERHGGVIREPVTQQRVRALITEPAHDQTVAAGDVAIRGLAWSGMAPIARVELSINSGAWQPAHLLGESRQHSWQRWELLIRLMNPGSTAIRARATDLAGRTQPDQPEWNRLGYGSNPIQEITVRTRY